MSNIEALITTVQTRLQDLDKLTTRVPEQMDYVIASGPQKNALYVRIVDGKFSVCGVEAATRFDTWVAAQNTAKLLVDGNNMRASALGLMTAIDYSKAAASAALEALKEIK